VAGEDIFDHFARGQELELDDLADRLADLLRLRGQAERRGQQQARHYYCE
jgi:hypothetical protein